MAEDAPKNDRRVKLVEIEAHNRDRGKVFKVTEKSAMAAEMWAVRVYLAMSRSGVEIPENVAAMGLMGLAVIGLNASRFIGFDEAKKILDELMECVEIVPDPIGNPAFVRKMVENDVSEVSTAFRLKREVLELHLGFSLADAGSIGGLLVAAQEELRSTSSSIETSPRQ